ncbi:MAG: flagellar motor protein MotB [Desulfobacteraceae bacterium]|nr:flagellar motor protein MotB [Desulfobacteraceae bacterium]
MRTDRQVVKTDQDPTHSGGRGGWQIIYTGFILIMLTFFIMLTSFSSLQQSKITRFVSAFSTAVSVFNGGIQLESGKMLIDSQHSIVNKEDKLARLFESVLYLRQKSGLEHLDLRTGPNGVALTLSDNLLFASGRAQLSPSANGLLEEIGKMVQKIPVPIKIEGHTDNRPITNAQFASNWELSTARAIAVLRYLVNQTGVVPARLSAVGYAQFQPVSANDTVAGRAKNRRVEIVFELSNEDLGS